MKTILLLDLHSDMDYNDTLLKKMYIYKSKLISYLISYHLISSIVSIFIWLAIFTWDELKAKGRKGEKNPYLARLYDPLHEFLKKKYKSVNEGINICVFEMYKQQPEVVMKEIENLINQKLDKEKELKELEESQTQKVISDDEKVISFLKREVISRRDEKISLSFDRAFSKQRLEYLLDNHLSEMGYQSDINSLRNDIKKLWDMPIEDLKSDMKFNLEHNHG